jgi:iron complex outermembrane receptor protein
MFKKTAVAWAASIAVTSLPLAVQAQSSPQGQQLDRVEITGSAIRRAANETALPVTVIRVDELTSQGVTTTEQALARIASNQSNFGASQAVGATTGGKAEADLRGLSGPTGTNSNKTLVLLNGRRLANHSFDAAAVDLNAIPLAAVDRIEVLRDGASAIYGSDAIGGVINFILKRELRGLEVGAQATQPQASGGGATQRFNIAGGFGSLSEQGFNVWGSLDWRRQSALEAKDRKFGSTGVIRGAVVAGTSGSSFPGDLNGFEPSLPSCAAPSSIPNPARTACRYDFTRDVDLLTENEQVLGVVRGTMALSTEHSLSLEYSYSNNQGTARVAPSPVSHAMAASSPFFPAGAPLSPSGVRDPSNPSAAAVPGGIANWRQVVAGKRTSGDDSTTDRLMVEAQGSWLGFDYRSALGTSRNKAEASVKRGYTNNAVIARGVFSGQINPFGATPEAGLALVESAQVVAPTMVGENRTNFVDLRLSRELATLAAGPVYGAFGVEYRTEKSSVEALDITAQLPSLGIDPDGDTSGSRKMAAAYAEVSIPVTKDLEVTLASRFDKYSGTGNTFNPKMGVRYQPSKQLVLRASANTGFRAPTLYEVYQPQSLSYTSDSYDDPLLCPGGTAVAGASAGVVCGQQVLIRTVGPVGNARPASALEPEKSRAFTLGAVFEPVERVTIGIDFWNLNVRNLISGLPEQEIFASASRYTGRFVRCSQLPAGAGSGIRRDDVDVCLNYPSFDPVAYIDSPVENLGELRTNGVDLSASWTSASTGMGRFTVGLDGTYIASYKYQRERGGQFIEAAGRYSDNAPVFRWQHVLSVNWKLGPWSTTLAQRYKSGYKDQDGTNDVGSYVLHDVAVAYTGIKNLTLAAGITNVMDQTPPLTGQVSTFQRGYDPRFTDPLGRAFLLRATYKFF